MKSQILSWGKLVEELVKDIPQETREFTREMLDESDRGLALICTEDLNLKLEMLLRMRFSIHTEAQVKKIIDPLFKMGGPLSFFASRISLAYSVGYIGELLFAELERIRIVRNKFAHSSRPLRFSSPEISAVVRQFGCGKDYKNLFLKAEQLPENLSAKKESSERWHFVGAYFHADFAIRTLTGTAPKPERLEKELERIQKEYGL